MAGAVLQLGLKAVVGQEAVGDGLLDASEVFDGAAGLEVKAAGGGGGVAGGGDGIRSCLVQVGKDLEFDAVFANVGDLEGGVVAELTLNGEMVALNVAGGQVLGDVTSLRKKRTEVGRGGKAGWEALLGSAETGVEWLVAGCADGICGARCSRGRERSSLDAVGVDDEGTVVAQHVLAAFAIELSVAKTVGRADDGLWIGLEGETKAGSEVELRHVDQSTVVDGTGGGLDEDLVDRIVVCEIVARLPLRRDELVTQTGVDGEPRVDADVVLEVEVVHPLVQMNDGEVVELVGIRCAEEEVCESDSFFGAGVEFG